MFAEVIEENLLGGAFLTPPPPAPSIWLNIVKIPNLCEKLLKLISHLPKKIVLFVSLKAL